MSPQDPQADAMLAHIVSQVEQNVHFLVSQGYIAQRDASAFLTKLPNVGAESAVGALPPRMPIPTRTPATPARGVPQVKALWAYSGDSDDLSFEAGDTIELVEETNADWWTGRINGKQGLFPSAYVERVAQAPAPGPSAPVTKPYKPFGAAHHGRDLPPPAGTGVNSVGLQEKAGQEQKKDKYGQYKNTLAHSAVGGVGFGAGSAIGGGLVRAIF